MKQDTYYPQTNESPNQDEHLYPNSSHSDNNDDWDWEDDDDDDDDD